MQVDMVMQILMQRSTTYVNKMTNSVKESSATNLLHNIYSVQRGDVVSVNLILVRVYLCILN